MMITLLKEVAVFLLFTLVNEAYSQKTEGDTCMDEYTNTAGVCTPAAKCNSARDDLQQNGIKPTFCAYTFDGALVCCRDGNTIFQTVKPSPTTDSRPIWSNSNSQNRDQRPLSERKCEEYSRGVVERIEFFPLLPDPVAMSISTAKCDYSGVELIVGGEDANVGEFPHMAAIGWANFEGGYSFNCGGSLISPRFVMTAGHCIHDHRQRPPAPQIVRLGDHNIDPAVDDGAKPVDVKGETLCSTIMYSMALHFVGKCIAKSFLSKKFTRSLFRIIDTTDSSGNVPIKSIHKHPEYKPPVKYNDIALLELASDVDFSSSIRPACLWSIGNFADYTKALATGWGVTSPRKQDTSKILQKVSLSLLENNHCNPLLTDVFNRNWQGFTETQMCAGELRGGKDTCQGDSGSPLQVASKDNSCIFRIIGVTSFGRECARSGQPGVYTRVSSYLPWIESIVWPGE